MADEQTQKLLQAALKAARSGNRDLARKAFMQVIQKDDQNETAWLGLATVGKDKKEQLAALRRVLQLNPDNDRARAAVQRLGVDPDRLLATSTQEMQRPPTPDPAPVVVPPPAPPMPDLPDYLRGLEDDPVSSPPASDFSTFSPDDAGDSSAFLAYDDEEDEGFDAQPAYDAPAYPETSYDHDDSEAVMPGWLSESGELPAVADSPISAVPDWLSADAPPDELTVIHPESPVSALFDAPTMVEVEVPKRSVTEIFNQLPMPARSADGIPALDAGRMAELGQIALERTQAHIDGLSQVSPGITWTAKRRGRIGERQATILYAQIAVAVLAFVLVAGGLILSAVLNSPDVQRVVFAPTWTLSPTPTVTPTNTPGVTPTPSPTSPVTLTPSPTIPPLVTPGRVLSQPEPTTIYIPLGVGRDAEIDRAARLMGDGQLAQALPLLERVREGTSNAGNFLPYFYLARWHLLRDDPATAREVLTAGEQLWQERSPNTNYGPLVELGYAEVILAEARQLIAERAPQNTIRARLDEMERRADAAITADGRNIEAILIKAQRYILEARYDEALRILTQAQESGVTDQIFVDTRLRLAKAGIYIARREYDTALQELYELLYIQPYQEEALILQAEVALLKDEPGLAVIYAEQYLARYPGSVLAFKLRGDGWAREGKFDQALLQYERALLGEEDDPAYIEVLLSRAALYESARQYTIARDDLTRALLLSGDDPAIRARRMNVAYLAGSYSVARNDAQTLASFDVVPAAELALLEARILIDEARPAATSDYQEALALLATVRGLDPIAQAIADEYSARAHYRLGDLTAALAAINRALTVETGSRYYLRGIIQEETARAQQNATTRAATQAAALRDYEFVLAWSRIYPYAFRADAQARYDALLAELAAG